MKIVALAGIAPILRGLLIASMAIGSCTLAPLAVACTVGAVNLTEIRKTSDIIATGIVRVIEQTERRELDTQITDAVIELRRPRFLKNQMGSRPPLLFRSKMLATDDGCFFGTWPPTEGARATVYLSRSNGPSPKLALIYADVQEEPLEVSVPEYPLPCVYVDNLPTADLESHAECAARAGGALRVSEDHLARMSYLNGLASVVIDKHWYYVMRNGRSLAVLTYDNGPDDFSEGLTRSPVGDKIAYFDSAFQQVVGPKYDWGWPFEGGRALVCIGCKLGKPDDEGHSSVSGGLWGYIDRSGKEVVPVKLSQDEVRAR